MTTKKTSTPKQPSAKKAAKPAKKAVAKKGQPVPAADTVAIETTQPVATPAGTTTEQAPVEPAPAEATPATDSTILVWPEKPTAEETDLATYHMWITACGRYRVYRSVARLTGADHHFNAEVRIGDNGYHTIEMAKDGCGRPRDYRTLDSAVEVCRLHFAGVQSGATSDETAMFAHARAHGLDVLPPVTNRKPQAGDGQESTKRTRKASKPKADTPRKLSAIDAAAKVLAEAGKPMNCKEMIEAMATRGYWTSPGGLTPDATLYSSIAREIKLKGTASRFKKADRGQFALNAAS